METVLLIAHGTRESRGNDEATAVAAEVARILASRGDHRVQLCFLEHAEPGIPGAIESLYAEGIRTITALPVILTAAGHMKNDIPAAIARACDRFPDLRITSAHHLGVHADLLAVLADRCDAIRVPHFPKERTGLVVIGRGAADPDANAEIYKVARLLWEARPAAHLAVGFMGVTTPTAGDAIRESARLLNADNADAEGRILVVPYFLFEGRLLDRLRKEAADLEAASPIKSIRVAAPIGADPRLANVLAFRLQELREGTGRLNCGTCLYRVPMTGHESSVGGEMAREASLRKAHLGGRT